MNELTRTINSTLELKPGQRVTFPSGTSYVTGKGGELRRGFQKLSKKERRKNRETPRKSASA